MTAFFSLLLIIKHEIDIPETAKLESKMRKWNITTPRSESRRFKLHLVICELKSSTMAEIPCKENYAIQVHTEWKESGKNYLPGRTVERSHTSKQSINSDGSVRWNEGFDHDSKLKLKNAKRFRSRTISFEVHMLAEETNGTASVTSKLRMDIAEYYDPTECSEKIIQFPVKFSIGGSIVEAKLIVKLNFSEIQAKHNGNMVHPLSPTQLLPTLSSCIKIPKQESNDMYSSFSDTDEYHDPVYGSIVITNLSTNGLGDENLEYSRNETWEKDQSVVYHSTQKPSVIRLLSRRLGFRNREYPKGTPLLNKAYDDEGGDDIDRDRRFHLIPNQPRQCQAKYGFELSRSLGSNHFEIGNWEKKRLISRDGKLELVTEIFLASIDQRSEKASGEGACTVLAAVIADWLHQNKETLPLRCQFDKLIRDGSLEWRNLCKEETHKEKFLDRHFDLDTVIKAQVRPLTVVSGKSYVGFFELENMPNKFEFLQGAMSFDNIWQELQSEKSTTDELIYVVSWNDHFFALKIERDAIYIIDTLGERLCEGCNKAYILKFNSESKVYRVQHESSNPKADTEESLVNHSSNAIEEKDVGNCQLLICEGRSTCKEFIKEFLAALPLRELQANIEKGIVGESPLHHLLQIEFHYTAPGNKNLAKHGDEILMNQPCEVE